MKQKFKNILKLFAIGTVFVLIGCEKDLYENALNPHPPAPFESRTLNFNQLPLDIKDFVNQSNVNFVNRSAADNLSLEGAIFSESRIIVSTDTLQNTNYSLYFRYETTPTNIFYNLVVNSNDKEERSAYIFKYICDENAFQEFESSNYNMFHFKGMTEIKGIDFSNPNPSIFKREGDDLCTLYLPSIPQGGGGGGGGSNSSTGFNTAVLGYIVSAGSGNYSVSVGGTTYYSGGGVSPPVGTVTGHEGCYGSHGSYWYYNQGTSTPHQHRDDSDPCPQPPDGYVGANTPYGPLLQPCNNVNNLIRTDLGDIKPSMNWIKNELGLGPVGLGWRKELGVSVKKKLRFGGVGFDYIKTQIISEYDTPKINMAGLPGNSNIGGIHSHYFGTDSTPSFGDLQLLLQTYNEVFDSKKPDVFMMIMSKNPTTGVTTAYNFTINSITNLRSYINMVITDPANLDPNGVFDLEVYHEKLAEKNSLSNGNLEKVFLTEFGHFGIDMLKSTDASDFNTWETLKLEVDPANPTNTIVTKTPCN